MFKLDNCNIDFVISLVGIFVSSVLIRFDETTRDRLRTSYKRIVQQATAARAQFCTINSDYYSTFAVVSSGINIVPISCKFADKLFNNCLNFQISTSFVKLTIIHIGCNCNKQLLQYTGNEEIKVIYSRQFNLAETISDGSFL